MHPFRLGSSHAGGYFAHTYLLLPILFTTNYYYTVLYKRYAWEKYGKKDNRKKEKREKKGKKERFKEVGASGATRAAKSGLPHHP